ncbi:hypothetical protein JXR93_02400 [bacterium]|nr:hypothetical protein [bacterium]
MFNFNSFNTSFFYIESIAIFLITIYITAFLGFYRFPKERNIKIYLKLLTPISIFIFPTIESFTMFIYRFQKEIDYLLNVGTILFLILLIIVYSMIIALLSLVIFYLNQKKIVKQIEKNIDQNIEIKKSYEMGIGIPIIISLIVSILFSFIVSIYFSITIFTWGDFLSTLINTLTPSVLIYPAFFGLIYLMLKSIKKISEKDSNNSFKINYISIVTDTIRVIFIILSLVITVFSQIYFSIPLNDGDILEFSKAHVWIYLVSDITIFSLFIIFRFFLTEKIYKISATISKIFIFFIYIMFFIISFIVMINIDFQIFAAFLFIFIPFLLIYTILLDFFNNKPKNIGKSIKIAGVILLILILFAIFNPESQHDNLAMLIFTFLSIILSIFILLIFLVFEKVLKKINSK